MYTFLTITGLVVFISILIGTIFWIGVILFREFRQIFFGYSVPFVMTPRYKLERLVNTITLEDGQVFLDIGCGDGRVLSAMNQKYPKNKIIGYERSPLPYKKALEKKEAIHGGYTVLMQDFFTASIDHADVIYAYMMPHLMTKIWKKIEKECKKGTLLYTNSFPISGLTPRDVIKFDRDQAIYLYVVR